MGRLVDWPQRLSAHCEAWRQRAFDWDGSDCVTFAGDAILAITGQDVIEDIRGRYHTKVGALRVIKNEGFDSLGDMIAARLTECRVDQLRRGDVALFPGEDGDFVGVVLGTFAVAPWSGGSLIQVNLQFAERGFQIDG